MRPTVVVSRQCWSRRRLVARSPSFAQPLRCARALSTAAASPVCESCESLPARPAHSIHAVLLTDAAAASWPARFSSSDSPAPIGLCAAIEKAQRRILRANAAQAASTTPSAPDTGATVSQEQHRILASVARITRHSRSTTTMRSVEPNLRHHNRDPDSLLEGWFFAPPLADALLRRSVSALFGAVGRSLWLAVRLQEGDILIFPQRRLLRLDDDGATVEQRAEAVSNTATPQPGHCRRIALATQRVWRGASFRALAAAV